LKTRKKALERIDQKEFDIVVTDIRMDEVDGLQVLEHVRQSSERTKVIMITGYAMMAVAREAMKRGHLISSPSLLNRTICGKSSQRPPKSSVQIFNLKFRKPTDPEAGEREPYITESRMHSNENEAARAIGGDGKRESLNGRYERIKAVDVARKALLSRKRLSLRLQICLSFFIVFLVAAVAAYVVSEANAKVEKKLRFLEIANDFTVEIIQARRFEKNFFLYNTNLDDALENIYQAKGHL